LGNTDNELIISGEGLDKKKFVIKIDEEEIKNPVIKGDSIAFTYKLPDGPEKKEFLLHVFDEQGKEVYTSKLIKGEASIGVQNQAPVQGTDTSQSNSETLNQEEFGDADAPDDANTPQE
jgi:hypothetical protein